MNANELADELEDKDRLWNVDENLMIKTCAMLRQQQAEIEALKVRSWEGDSLISKLSEEIEELKDGIEKLKDAYCQKDHEVKKAEQYCLDAFDRGRQIGYADGMISKKAQEK